MLVGHLKEQMDRQGVDSRMQMSVYYFETKGGLTSADLLTELARDSKLPKLPNSDLFKSLVDQLASDDLKMDKHVLQKVQEAFKLVKPKLDQDFYGLSQEEEPVTSEAEAPQQEEAQEKEQ